MSSRIAIASNGDNVLTTPDKDLLFSSDSNNLKIWRARQVTITVPDDGFGFGDVIQSYSHGLSYQPTFQVFHTVKSGTHAGRVEPYVTQGANNFTQVYTTSSNIVFDLNQLEAGAHTFYYLIFVDPVSSGIRTGALNSKIRIAKSGINALTDDNETNYHFLSNRPVFNVAQKSTSSITLTASNVNQINTISHGLGYVPLAIVQEINEGPRLPYIQGNLALEYFLDSNNIYIEATQAFTSLTIPLSFRIQIFTQEYGEAIN